MATPVPRPTWLKITSTVAVLGIAAWPVLVMLAVLGTIDPATVLVVGIVTAGLAYISIRRIKHDRALVLGPDTDPGPGTDPERE